MAGMLYLGDIFQLFVNGFDNKSFGQHRSIPSSKHFRLHGVTVARNQGNSVLFQILSKCFTDIAFIRIKLVQKTF